ncbi:MAG: BrnT family toxin [Candidatus Omnitrophica bacterium]|nr:BrnT family toxin [Candidatus Omnitrophota bacterium]
MDRFLGSFVWDEKRDKENSKKHGVNFLTATQEFSDPKRKIFTDARHSKNEERYFCIGIVGHRILTVRFMYRNDKIRIFGAGYWRKGRKYYEEDDKG